MRTLLPKSVSKTRVHLIQVHDILIINSNCCNAEVKTLDKHGNESDMGGDILCRACGDLLMVAASGWLAILREDDYDYEQDPQAWGNWGRFWFGVEDFAMGFSE